MAHDLLFDDDGKACIMYVDDVPWHQLGERRTSPPTAEEAIRAAGLAWHVAKTPVFYHESIECTGVVPGHYAMVPTEGWTKRERPVFGIVTDQYEPLQNTEAFAFFDPLVADGNATYETAGALGHGERVWVLARLKGTIRIGQNGSEDEVRQYILLSNSHDGKSTVQIKFTPIRVVCNNTLTMALSQGEALQVVHAPDIKARIAAAQSLFTQVVSVYKRIADQFQSLAVVPVVQARLDTYLTGVFPDPAQPEPGKSSDRYDYEHQRASRDRHCCHVLFDRWRNRLRGTDGTLWGAYNSVTEYEDHRHATGNNRALNPSARLQSMWFGKGCATKIRAFNTAMAFAQEWKK